jgi:coenzyme F420-reducing hydrogenase alpha subunit
MNLEINVHHVTRVEGHGNIVVKVENGQVKETRWEVPEAPRFFEAMVRGHHYSDAPYLVSRVCGICSIAHTFAALQAIEDALEITLEEESLLLRKLLLHAETLQSHILHVGYLALPDFLGVPNVIPLAKTHKNELLTVVRLHRLANEMSDAIGGRTTHPVNTVVGGWTKVPDREVLKHFQARLKEAVNDLRALVDFWATLEMPDFERETEYIALYDPNEYAFYGGQIASTDEDKKTPLRDYRNKIREFIVPYSTAKRAKSLRESFMVGALARFNINYKFLSPLAQECAEKLGLKPRCYNSFMNNAAQIVESAHAIEESIRIIDELLKRPPKANWYKGKGKAGRGVGAVEAPRGLLIHEYVLDDEGRVKGANLVIPTNQNHQNIEEDLKAYLPKLLGKPKEEITLKLEMLVRAYDPCISCSTHFLRIEWE